MSLLQQDYTALFNGITGVLNTLEHMNCGQAQADLSQLNITAERTLLQDTCARAAARNESDGGEEEGEEDMDEYRMPYQALADGIVDALQNLRDHNFGLAEARLRRAQQTAEELFSKLWEEEVRREEEEARRRREALLKGGLL